MIATQHEGTRPRVEGEREHEILSAALEVLAEVGYDRVTMDAVAARAKASKATLYRRWNGKVTLIIDALLSLKTERPVPDTGSLRGDLLEAFCSDAAQAVRSPVSSYVSVVTALSRDEELAEAFRRDVLAPKIAATRAIFERAKDRGEIPAAVDLDLLTPALPAILMHRSHVLGAPVDSQTIAAVIDQIILPATRTTLTPSTTATKEHR